MANGKWLKPKTDKRKAPGAWQIVKGEDPNYDKFNLSPFAPGLFPCVICLLFAVFLCGCASQQVILENHKNEFMARPLSELKRELNKPGSYPSTIGWKETTYSLANGNSVYVEPLSKDCSLHWEINPEGTIIGAETKGSGCGELKDSGSNVGLSHVKSWE